MLDIISIGDATIDTFLIVDDIRIKKIHGQQEALISWGDKLPVKKMYRTVAGNAANNAVGSARLGLKTAYYTVLAHDSGGREIVHKMKKEGVSTDYIIKNDKHGTNASFVLSHNGERTIFVYHEHRKYHLPKFAPSKWVYLTSTGPGFEKMYPDLAKYLDKSKAKLGFNPGTFQLRKGPKANKLMLERTELISLNIQEAQEWVGNTNDPKELCVRLAKLGPKVIALTDGDNGAYSLSEQGFYHSSNYPGPRIEATGAGDAFTTGYMAALIYGKDHIQALRWGTVNAGNVMAQVGPQAGLQILKQIEALSKKLKKLTVKQIN